jgi:D-aminopeptidase
VSGWRVGALVVVNAVGDVIVDGRVICGPRAGRLESGLRRRVDFADGAGSEKDTTEGGPRVAENTTLAVVATDAPVDDAGLVKLARLASTALARRISPVHTPFDGDLTFALSTAEFGRILDARTLLDLGMAARDSLETSIVRAVQGAGR